MTHTCNRCRTQYESGSFYNGQDYCMNCYTALMREEEGKRRREEAIKAEAAAKTRREQERRILEQEMKKREMLEERKRKGEKDGGGRSYRMGGWAGAKSAVDKRKDDEKELAKRRLYDNWKKRLEMLREARRKDGERDAPQRKRERVHTTKDEGVLAQEGLDIAHSLHELVVEGPSHKPAKKVQEMGGRLELSVKKGLPVSLSIGQKKNRAMLLGSNISAHRTDVELFAVVQDAEGKRVECKIEPKQCAIEPNENAEFEVRFDLGEDAARGNLKLEAYLKERAVYLEGGLGRSNPLELETNVKTPMQLEYKKGSAKFGEEGISLGFDNVGESGGILNVKSKFEYGQVYANLKGRKNIKGYEKDVQLLFAPANEGSMENIKVFLVGVDANGKEYRLVKTIKEKI